MCIYKTRRDEITELHLPHMATFHSDSENEISFYLTDLTFKITDLGYLSQMIC